MSGQSNNSKKELNEFDSADSGVFSGCVSEQIFDSSASIEPEQPEERTSETKAKETARQGQQQQQQNQKLIENEPEMDSGVISERMSSMQIEEQPVKPVLKDVERYFESNAEGDTFLHLAIIWPHKQASQKLIQCAPEPSLLNIQNDVYLAPIHLAVLTSQADIVRDLVVAGAKPTVRERVGNTALHLACQDGELQCVRALLVPLSHIEASHRPGTEKFPQDLELWNYDGETCVHIAARCKKETKGEILKLLIEAGADVNAREGKQGRTILHKACEEGDLPLVSFLLSQCRSRLDLEVETYSGLTAYQIAATNATFNPQKYEKIVEKLRENNAEQLEITLEDDSGDEFEDVSERPAYLGKPLASVLQA